jgi:sugar phosphate isomerase/epimerase
VAGSAPVLVLVAGGLPDGDRDLPSARARAADAIAALVDDASAAGVVLAIEPMHPIYAADRGVISTLGQALDIAEQFPASAVGVVVDTFHVWWDPQVQEQICRAGQGGRIASYQVCDWITPLPDPLLGRGMMGDGHIDFAAVTRAVAATGYAGDIEVEIFHQAIWDADPAEVAERTAKSFEAHVGPWILRN